MAKSTCDGYVLNDISDDKDVVKRLFGASGKGFAVPARLQFFDLFLTQETIDAFNGLDTDTYIGEVKFENTISRSSGVANPRQIERVPAGAVFAFKLVYNVEIMDEIEEDIKTLADGIQLLENDYLGGHGSRGYGRVKFENLTVEAIGKTDVDTEKYAQILRNDAR